MSRYLKEAPQEEAMAAWEGDGPEPLTHTVYTFDFMCLARHDIACPVCMNAHAMIRRNVTPGQYQQTIGPCFECDKGGWRLLKMPAWLQRLVGLFVKEAP